jgi:hypothetical protein
LDSFKSILVFSHNHNSFDKKELLKQMPNPNVHDTSLLPKDFVKESDILKFFMEDIDKLLENYELGKPDYKPDVKKQLEEIKIQRENKMKEIIKQQNDYQNAINKINMAKPTDAIQGKINEQSMVIQQLTFENNHLKEQVQYLENKIKQLISAQLEKRKEEKKIELTQDIPIINII